MISPWEWVNQTCDRLGIKPADRLLVVRIATQTLQFYRNDKLVRSYVISTSLRPPSNVKDSLGTPRGLHAIAERIGAGQPPGMVFKARVPTGRHFSELPDADQHPNLITSRILWLRGLEPGVNAGGEVDTHDRYIYIHGTNHEDRLGTPQSAGCVLMNNREIVELYEDVRAGDFVWIE
ncbi:MAG: L,D-transpeptidase [Verrucomicrobia bacterium]|nr:L,D-transpeptidase [Verrucomicrobiota bacterium]